MNSFNQQGGHLRFEIELPPPDNACHRSGPGGTRYPAAEYKTWLEHAAPQLGDILGAWEPDTEAWWHVEVELHLGARGDGQNYLKPLLDLLSGAYVVGETHTDAKGRRIGKGTILKPGGLWDDDRRVRDCNCTVAAIRHPLPYAVIEAYKTTAPPDIRAGMERQARTAKQAAKAEEIASRTIATTREEWAQWLREHQAGAYIIHRTRVRRALKASDEPVIAVTFTAGEWAKLRGNV